MSEARRPLSCATAKAHTAAFDSSPLGVRSLIKGAELHPKSSPRGFDQRMMSPNSRGRLSRGATRGGRMRQSSPQGHDNYSMGPCHPRGDMGSAPSPMERPPPTLSLSTLPPVPSRKWAPPQDDRCTGLCGALPLWVLVTASICCLPGSSRRSKAMRNARRPWSASTQRLIAEVVTLAHRGR